MKFSYVLALALSAGGVSALNTLGQATESALLRASESTFRSEARDLQHGEPERDDSLSSVGGYQQAAIGRAARVFSAADVRTLRAAASAAFEAGKKKVAVTLSGGRSETISAIPDYISYSRQIAHTRDGYSRQTERLKQLLNDAWDEAIAHGHLESSHGRIMYEFTGMDKKQRHASKYVYAPDGTVSVYMHGSPDSLSRHAIIIEPLADNPRRAWQVFRDTEQPSTGKTRRKEYGYSDIAVSELNDRIAKEGIPDGVPILFRACSTGGCPVEGDSVAQQLADISNRPVVAASDTHYRPVDKADETIIRTYVKGDTGPGEWRLFLPRPWHHDLPQYGSLTLADHLRGSHELKLLPRGAFSSIDLGGDLANFSGRRNRGAILDAAVLLAPGGQLQFHWHTGVLKKLQRNTSKRLRKKFVTQAQAEKRELVVDQIAPHYTLIQLDSSEYEYFVRQKGEKATATVRRR